MKDEKMSDILTQENLDRAHKALDWLIDLTEKARVECCNQDLTDARDRLDQIGGHLRFARSEAGKLQFPGGVTPRSGGEK